MLAVLIIFSIIIILMITSIIFFPSIKIGKIEFQSYWVITLIGAIVLIAFKLVPIKTVINELSQDSSINPLKILTLFISMTILSVYLDELGFFKYLAVKAIQKAKCKQISIFLSLYLVTSILTIFTSNDIIILTLTPFICYFCKHTKINPIPYLVSEFVSANTWSMMLIIGNPTNIYLGTLSNINFVSYMQTMFLPTIAGGIVSFSLIMLLFRKSLRKPMEVFETEEVRIKDKFMLCIGLIHLILCTILLAISSYVGFEMWSITFFFALSLLAITIIYSILKGKDKHIIINILKRAPWTLIPFVLSMFVIVLALANVGLPKMISENLFTSNPVLGYGLLSFVSANIMNNIPMSVFFGNTIMNLSSNANYLKITYSVIIGSNIGAYLTPIGALAGIMWMTILKKNDVNFSFIKFIKYGVIISVPTILASLLVLMII